MQMQGNMYYAFTNLGPDYITWSELFGLIEEETLYQKRVLAAVSGAILPLVALGFIKSLVDYIKPEDTNAEEVAEDSQLDFPEEEKEEWDEMHAHDMVLNDMVDKMDDEDIFEPEPKDEEDLLENALKEKAEQEKIDFLKQTENDTENTV